MILEPVRDIRVRWLIRPGLGGWVAAGALGWIIATQVGMALRALLVA